MHLKHEDTRLILVVTALFIALAVILGEVLGAASIPLTLGLAVMVLMGLLLHLYRARQQEDAAQLRQVQALLTLYTQIPLRGPLPWMTGWAATPELATTLYELVRTHRPRRVVELGSGASTLVIAYALEQNGEGQLLSLDQDATYGAATARQLAAHGLEAHATVVHAPLVEVPLEGKTWTWYDPQQLPQEGPVDLLVVDGPHRELQQMARYPALPMLAGRLSPRAVVVLDDAHRKDERRIAETWAHRFKGMELTFLDSPKGTAILRRTA